MTIEDTDRLEELADRAALGESLSPEERRALAAWEEEDPLGIAEARLFTAMAALDGPVDPAGDRRVADAAVAQVLSERKRATRRRAWTLAWGGGALAAAAGIALLVGSREGPSVATQPVLPSAVLVHASGSVLADGAPASQGARVARGSEIQVQRGVACLELEAAMHVCLAEGARARLTGIGGKDRRVDLLAGRVAVGLAALPPGERLSVVAGSTWSTAIGTAFTVERAADGSVQTVVHEGKVRVGGDGSGTLVPAHKIGLARGVQVELADVTDHERTETPDWLALGKLAGRSIEGPMPDQAAAEPAAPSAPEASVVAADPAPRAPSGKEVAAPQRTATELLSAARQALRDQRWQEAAAAYRALTAEHPSSPEARTALVPLAGLEIDRLGQPQQGLRRLEAYLETGGALAVEARLAKIRALRSMGRSADEARAIEEFVAAHPNALEAARLTERLETLRAR